MTRGYSGSGSRRITGFSGSRSSQGVMASAEQQLARSYAQDYLARKHSAIARTGQTEGCGSMSRLGTSRNETVCASSKHGSSSKCGSLHGHDNYTRSVTSSSGSGLKGYGSQQDDPDSSATAVAPAPACSSVSSTATAECSSLAYSNPSPVGPSCTALVCSALSSAGALPPWLLLSPTHVGAPAPTTGTATAGGQTLVDRLRCYLTDDEAGPAALVAPNGGS